MTSTADRTESPRPDIAIDLKTIIRSVPDFPKPGILFYDISTVLAHAAAWRQTIDRLAAVVAPMRPELLVGIESRGFLLAAPLALELRLGFIMVRKAGKLPGDIVRHHYDLEYGADILEVQQGAISPAQRVVVLDDLLATGGTLAATIALLRQVGADVRGAACIVELSFLDGRRRLDVPVETLVAYRSSTDGRGSRGARAAKTESTAEPCSSA